MSRHRVAALVALCALVLAIALAAPSRPPSVEAASIASGPHVTNVTDRSFVVSWVTTTPSEGHVRYGTESGRYPSRADDVRGAGFVSTTHLVRISGLLGANTRYYYSVVSGDSTLDSPSTYFVITGPTTVSASEFLVSGRVLKADDSEAVGALVYVFPQRKAIQTTSIPSRMVWLAALADSDGRFSVDIGPARANTSAEKTVGGSFGALAVGDRVRHKSIGGVRAGGEPNETEWQQLDLTQAILDDGEIELDALSLPYAELPTPSPSATPTRTLTPSATPTGLAATSTASASATPTQTRVPAASATSEPTVSPTRPPEATVATIASATAASTAAAVPSGARPSPSATPSPAAPRSSPALGRQTVAAPSAAKPLASTPLVTPAAGAMRPRSSSPTARPTSAAESPTSAQLGALDDAEPLSGGLLALFVVAGILLVGGLALSTVGIARNLRRRSA